MDEERRKQLIKQRAAAKASLTRLQKYIDSGEHKANQLPSTSTSQRSSENKVSQSQMSYDYTRSMPSLQGTTQAVSVWQVHQWTTNTTFSKCQQLQLCFNCLQLFNKTHVCLNYACRTCNKPHHTLLHTAMQIQSADRQGSTNDHNASSIAKQNVTPVTNNSTDKSKTYCSLKN